MGSETIEIDDVRLHTTLYSDKYDTHGLYRIAEEVVSKLQHVENSGKITISVARTAIHVYIDPDAFSHGLSRLKLRRLQDIELSDGERLFAKGNREITVETGRSFAMQTR